MIIRKKNGSLCLMFLWIVFANCAHAGFAANDGVNHVDYLGMAWKVDRKGKEYAIAIANSSADTFDDLAVKVKLDTKDYTEWAHTADQRPVRCKEYKIPNTLYFHNGAKKMWEHFHLTLLEFLISQHRDIKNKSDENKFKVVWRDTVSDSEIMTALKDDYLYQYYFAGHGAYTGINTYKSGGVMPFRYTKYGINLLRLGSCESAEKQPSAQINNYKYNDWESNVATRGRFIGYSGKAHIYNEIFLWRITTGTNTKGVFQ